MVYTCCVYGCTSNYDKKDKDNRVTVFKFPNAGERRNEWLRKLPNKDFKVTQYSRVCIKHFESHDVKRYDVFPCSNGDPDIVVSIPVYYYYILL